MSNKAESIRKRLFPTNQLHFWAALGPLLLLTSLAAALIKLSLDHLVFLIAALFGICLAFKWKGKGALIGLCAMGAAVVFAFPKLSGPDRLWQVGLQISVIFSFLVTVLSLEEASAFIKSLEQKRREEEQSKNEEITKRECQLHEMKKELAFNARQLQSALEESRILSLKYAAAENMLERSKRNETALSNECAALRKQEEILILREVSLSEELAGLRLQQQTFDPTYEQEYHQMRQQFDEKSETLARSRKELFSMESQLLTLQIRDEEALCEESQSECVFIETLKAAEEEMQMLEKERDDLQEIIATLLTKKKGGRPKKAKPKKEELADLFNS